MRSVLASCLLLTLASIACAGGEETLGPTLSPAPEAIDAASPIDGCGLSGLAESARSTMTWPNGWDRFGPSEIETNLLAARTIVRGPVVADVLIGREWGLDQVVCLRVDEVYRSADLNAGDFVTVVWFAASPHDPPIVFSNFVGLEAGREYVVVLRESNRPLEGFPVQPDFIVQPFDLFPTKVAEGGARPSRADVDHLISVARSTSPLPLLFERELQEHDLAMNGDIGAAKTAFSTVPDTAGTLSLPSDPTLTTKYQRIRDAVVKAGYDWSRVIAGEAFLLGVSVQEPPVNPAGPAVAANLLGRDDEIVAAWLESANDAWTLDEYDEALAADATYPNPPRSRAGPSVNLAEWFGVDVVASMSMKGSDPRVQNGAFFPPEFLQAFGDALDRELPTHPASEDYREFDPGCSRTGIGIVRADGFWVSLEYHADTNRLYAEYDGFWVEAPPEIPALLGVAPYTAGECYINPLKPTP